MSLTNELKHELESLLINNPDFAKVKSHVSRFNPIKVMGMEQMEIRHSNILGWLLNPRENHGLGDEFLKAFLCQAMSGQNKDIDALAINSRNLADANVFIEWKHIDLFIEIPDQEEPWCFVVENKLNSSQHSDQLTRYQETVDKHYKGDKKEYKKGYIFLTLNDEEADNDSYVPINYRDVVTILELVIQQYQSSLSTRIYNFINYYLETIRELCDMSESDKQMKQLAKQLYQDNKKALDFIFSHGTSTEFDFGVDQFLSLNGEELSTNSTFEIDKQHYVFSNRNKRALDFVPKAWADILNEASQTLGYTGAWPGCEKWRHTGLPIIVWLDLHQTNGKNGEVNYIRLVIEVGPIADHKVRQAVIEALSARFNLSGSELKFRAGALNEGTKYSKCFSDKVKLKDSQDSEEIATALGTQMKKLASSHTSYIEKGLRDFANQLTPST